MAGRTINGKPIAMIMEELKAPLGEGAIKLRSFDKQPYISEEALRSRLDSVLGKEHYNEKYEQIKIESARDTMAVIIKARIEVLDDDFTPILVKEAGGGSSVSFLKDNPNQALDLPNTVASACTDAFKRICKARFGIGEAELDAAKAKSANNAKGEEKIITLNNNVTYGTGNYFFTPITVDGAVSKLAVFKNELETFKAGIPVGTPAGTSYKMNVRLGKDKNNNEQYVFNSFCV